MPYLILVRHSSSQQDASRPSEEWGLSFEGRTRCLTLSARLRAYQPQVLKTSPESKALETAQIVGESLGLFPQVAEGLREHQRRNEPFYPDVSVFYEKIRQLFAYPEQLIFGEETALETYQRVGGALEQIVNAYPEQNILAVTHGTAMSIVLAGLYQVDGFDIWQSWGMPAYVVMDVPEYRLVNVVWNID